MTGVFYGVGVGPGDPELITVKAKKVIETSPCIAIPQTGANSSKLALTVIAGYLHPAQEILELTFPMTTAEATLHASWTKAAGQIMVKLDTGRDVCLVTLGDPTLYSTCMRVYRLIVKQGYRAEIIPGITSMCAIAAKTGISLAENEATLAVVPASARIDLETVLREYDNIVLLKVSQNYETVKAILRKTGLEAKAVTVSRCGLPGERISTGLAFENEKPDYFTTIIVKKDGI